MLNETRLCACTQLSTVSKYIVWKSHLASIVHTTNSNSELCNPLPINLNKLLDDDLVDRDEDELDKVANEAHHQETEASSLGDLDELWKVAERGGGRGRMVVRLASWCRKQQPPGRWAWQNMPRTQTGRAKGRQAGYGWISLIVA